jgi:hypothetical protein
MTKKALLPQSRHHVMIYDEDWKWLERHYGPGSQHEKVGISGAVKTLVHRFVTRSKDQALQRLDQVAGKVHAIKEELSDGE